MLDRHVHCWIDMFIAAHRHTFFVAKHREQTQRNSGCRPNPEQIVGQPNSGSPNSASETFVFFIGYANGSSLQSEFRFFYFMSPLFL
jgi:hypothetical protein